MVLGGTPVRRTLRTFAWASFEVTWGFISPVVSQSPSIQLDPITSAPMQAEVSEAG